MCLKILDKEKTARLMRRFIGRSRPCEGEVALAMDHPNVVKTFEHGVTTNDEQYLVMELLKGTGLNVMLETGDDRLKSNRLGLLIQAGLGLAHVHQRGFIHRDVCPRNFILDRDGRLKLIDFGLAVPNTPEFGKPGNRTGTIDYMAPELIRRQRTDARIDVFGLGVLAYEVFTGRLPWESCDSLGAMVERLNSPGLDPRRIVADLDDETAHVLTKAIQRDPNDRYQNMIELVEAFRRLAGK